MESIATTSELMVWKILQRKGLRETILRCGEGALGWKAQGAHCAVETFTLKLVNRYLLRSYGSNSVLNPGVVGMQKNF